MSPQIKTKRVNESIFAGQERVLLHAMAKRLPKCVRPDHLTALGVVGGTLVLVGYVLGHRAAVWLWLANVGLILHWLGDSLDGTLARHRDTERPRYGFYLDQVIDTVTNLLIALGVGLSPWGRLDCALLVLAAYQMLSIQVCVRTIVDNEFHMAVGRFGPTELRLGIFAMNIGILVFGAPTLSASGLAFTWCDILMMALTAFLLALLAAQMIKHLRRLHREEANEVRSTEASI